jgi:hypothetical protein
MTINLSPRIREALYVFTGIGSIAVTYLGATETISAPEMAAWSAFTVFVASLAGFNVQKSPHDQPPVKQ